MEIKIQVPLCPLKSFVRIRKIALNVVIIDQKETASIINTIIGLIPKFFV